MDVNEFIALPHRFRWGGIGGDDCFTFAASWVREQTGIDPAQEFRGTYSTREGAHSLIEAHGGEVSFAGMALARHGLTRVTVADNGSVGIVKALAGETAATVRETLVGAVKYGPLWAFITPGGVVCRKAEPVAIWAMK